MPELRTKRCTKCDKEKLESEFHKNNQAKDGLTFYCKGCIKLANKRSRELENIIVKKPDTKRCTLCGREKLLSDFEHIKKHEHSSHGRCKDCKDRLEKMFYSKFNKEHQQEIINKNSRRGLESWQQIESVLRELAETQLTINDETESIEKRINAIKSQADAVIEPCVLHQIVLQTMLAVFLKKELSKDKRAVHKFQFGKILWNAGKVNIELNTEFAKERLGKP